MDHVFRLDLVLLQKRRVRINLSGKRVRLEYSGETRGAIKVAFFARNVGEIMGLPPQLRNFPTSLENHLNGAPSPTEKLANIVGKPPVCSTFTRYVRVALSLLLIGLHFLCCLKRHFLGKRCTVTLAVTLLKRGA